MGYEKKKLKDCCVFVSDGDHLPPPKTKTGIPFITISDIDSNNQLSFENAMYVPESYYEGLAENKKAQKGDILYSVVGSFGIPIYIEDNKKFVFQRHIAILRPNDSLDSRYLYYVMLNPQFYKLVDKLAIGCSQRTVTLDTLRNIEIEVPPIGVQRNIVSVLEKVDAQIMCNNKVCITLQEASKTLFNYWFTQFEFPNEDGKPYKSSGGEMVWCEELKREIPKGWVYCKLDDCIQNINTGLNPRQNFVLGNGDIRYITVKNLTTSGVLDFDKCDTIDAAAKSIIHNRSDVSVGDILFASIAPLGRCYLVQEEPKTWEINESVFSIRGKAGVVTPEFLYLHFISETFIKGATSSSTGSIFKGIRINTLLDMPIVLPPYELLCQFTDKVSQGLKLKHTKAEQTEKLKELRDWLLPLLMNGQATIKQETTK